MNAIAGCDPVKASSVFELRSVAALMKLFDPSND